METVECKHCKRTIALIERSSEFDATGEMSLLFKCPDKRCGGMTRLPLISYGKRSDAPERKDSVKH